MTSSADIPHVLLLEILSYLPPKSYLPYASVSKAYREASRERYTQLKDKNQAVIDAFQTNPLQLGNLYLLAWFKPSSKISTKLLDYYISCGWDYRKYESILMRESLSRGDMPALRFLVEKLHLRTNNVDYCTVAGAAGQLEALVWLRDEHCCPCDIAEVYEEASENYQLSVINYLERELTGSFNTETSTSF